MTAHGSVFIIGEAGVNHNGSLDLALKLVDIAVEARVNAIKFQTFTPEKVISTFAPKAEYQTKTTGSDESQLDMVRKLWLSEQDHQKIIDYCKKKEIQFMSSPFDLDSIDVLADRFEQGMIKIPSGEITNAPYLLKIARKRRSLVVSTGMSTLGEVEVGLGILAFGFTTEADPLNPPNLEKCASAFRSEAGQLALRKFVSLLHCTTEYPAPFDEVNLRAMDTLSDAFGLRVGFSDHTPGISIPIAAVARGAKVIEKHFTIDKGMNGPDHKASLNPQELIEMVRGIRQVESALGNGIKLPAPSEIKNIPIARKSLVAARAVRKGESWNESNLTIKRPGNGISALHFWEQLGSTATRDYQEDELV